MASKETKPSAKDLAVAQPKEVVPYDAETLAMLAAPDDYNNLSRADVAVPFLQVLQSLSPACTFASPAYIDGARPGQIYHTTTREIVGESVWVTPVVYKRSYIEWVPRNAGGGFRGEFDSSTHEAIFNARRNAKGRAILENGNELLETLTFFVLFHKESGATEPAIIAMTITQTGAARIWNNMQRDYRPPGLERSLPLKRYAARYLLGTQMKTKAQNTWFVWNVLRAQQNDPQTVLMAREFEKSILGGAVVVDRTADVVEEPSDENQM